MMTHKHFLVLLAGSLIFLAVFLWGKAPMPASNFQGAQRVDIHTKQTALRIVVPYATFLVVLFGHRFFTSRAGDK